MRTKMPSWMQKWVKKLESGNYRQAKESLYDEPYKSGQKASYCCLGVLCRVAEEEKIKELSRDWKDDGSLNDDLRLKLGITRPAQTKFIRMNDEDGKSFKEIAADIRKNWKKYLTKTALKV